LAGLTAGGVTFIIVVEIGARVDEYHAQSLHREP
jgi:hypothetical protein